MERTEWDKFVIQFGPSGVDQLFDKYGITVVHEKPNINIGPPEFKITFQTLPDQPFIRFFCGGTRKDSHLCFKILWNISNILGDDQPLYSGLGTTAYLRHKSTANIYGHHVDVFGLGFLQNDRILTIDAPHYLEYVETAQPPIGEYEPHVNRPKDKFNHSLEEGDLVIVVDAGTFGVIQNIDDFSGEFDIFIGPNSDNWPEIMSNIRLPNNHKSIIKIDKNTHLEMREQLFLNKLKG